MSDDNIHVDDVVAAIQVVDDAEKAANAAQNEVAEAAERKRAAREALREKIKAGGTTGDRVKDWLIVSQRDTSEDTETFFRDLVDRVDRCQGEFVLVITRDEQPTKHTMLPEPLAPTDYALRTRFHLGVLDGELILGFTDGGWNFPTGTHVRFLDSYRQTPQLKEEDLWFAHIGFVELALGRPLETRNPFYRDEGHKELEIFIGNDEIGAWLEKPADHNELVALDLMKRDPEAAKKNPQWARRKHVEIFLKLVQAGNWEIPSISLLQTEHHAACVRARKQLMSALKTREELHGEIEASDSSGEVKTLHGELRQEVQKIKQALMKLRELGSETNLYARLRREFDIE